ncbi:VWA domain-containing protein [Spirosoma taeanense]|uniref:VWA domain-containing protein n=1 Tax=Spirosoma taeanense TaxID=2735870 RepID=A0A6M5Y8P7_9BACT|nr:vWA domain-containing protein [Spirosoma taeanense]QJW89142.1 VWA domain-containing protein [Spirosoma taeanense]
MTPHLLQRIRLACLALLFATIVRAADQDIDFNQDLPTFNITLIVGAPQVINIGVLGAPGNVTWDYFLAPTPIGVPGCASSPTNPYICQGLTITLPTGSVSSAATATVNWNGSAPPSGALDFSLIVDGHARGYHIDFRRPLDITFVLDKSGSMGLASSGGGGVTRWDALKTAVNNFMLKLSNPAFAQAGDRVGLTFFDNGITPSTFGNSLVPLDPGSATLVQTALNALAPGGGTAMGAGLNDGKAKLADAARSRDVLLFTDGEQNVAPLVNTNGCDIGGTAINANCPILPGSSGNLKMFTIGIGNPSPTYLSTLQNLATKNGGNCLLTSNGSAFTNTTSMVIGDINAVFTQAFIDLLRNNSPQLISTRVGTIGNDVQKLVDFPLNKNVDKLLIEVSLGKGFEIPQLARVLNDIRVSRNGQTVTSVAVPRWVGNAPDTYILVFSFNTARAITAKLRSEGQWDVTAQPNPLTNGLNYRITVIADDHLLDYSCRQQVAQPSAGSTQRFVVELNDRGKPITNATVTATVYQPGDDVGDRLARNPLKVRADARQQDRTAVGILKYNTLLARDPDFVRALLPKEQVITLTSMGNGRYEGSYPVPNIAGIYQMVYRLQGNDSLHGAYSRIEMQSMYVQPGQIDPGKSLIDKAVVNGRLVVTMRPVTTYDRFLGPAAADAFDVNAASAKLNNVVDNQDGSYTLTFAGNAKSNATISILQKPVFAGRLDRLQVSERIPDVARPFRPNATNVLIQNPNLNRINRVNRIPR